VLVDGVGGRVKLPVLVATPRRLILPAFSPWAGGAPWTPVGAASETLWVVARNRIFSLPRPPVPATLAVR